MDEATVTKNTTHTPGPWYVGAQNDLLFVIAGRAPSADNDYPNHDAVRTVIAQLEFRDKGKSEEAANARLIAAAPEMFALLQLFAAETFCEDTDGKDCRLDSGPYCGTHPEWIDREGVIAARKLLARVTGADVSPTADIQEPRS